MFTGIIHGQGTVCALHSQGRETRLHIRALYALEHIVIGESIAVNGVCLTVESCQDRQFTAYASAETMQRSNLADLRINAHVNLERALAMGDRLGGHIVSGHVDCLATVRDMRSEGQSLRITLVFPEEYAPELIPKGSVALDGISLTVNDCDRASLHVNVIPETARVTTVGAWRAGMRVNMETDIIGKYVRRMLMPWQSAGRITEDLLKQNGFM